jgi:hypothetical protein
MSFKGKSKDKSRKGKSVKHNPFIEELDSEMHIKNRSSKSARSKKERPDKKDAKSARSKKASSDPTESEDAEDDNDDGLGPTVLVRYNPKGNPTLSDFTNLSASPGFGTAMGFHPTVYLSSTDALPKLKMKTARDWWERASVAQQCDNVFGGFVPGTICYICGFPIARLPECEHILSVFKASMFLHLYRNDFKIGPDGIIYDSKNEPLNKILVDRLMFELLLEYKWAHRCCNQIKSDIDFVRFDGNSFIFDENNANEILEGIANALTRIKRDICSDVDLKRVFNDTLFREKKANKELIIAEWIEKRKRILSTPPNFNNPSSVESYVIQNEGAVGAILSYLNGGVTLDRRWFETANSLLRTNTSVRNYLMAMFGTSLQKIRFGPSLADPHMEQGLFMLQLLSRAILAADQETVSRVNSALSGVAYIPPPTATPEKETYTLAMTSTELATLLEDAFRYDWGRMPRGNINQQFEIILEYSSKGFAADFNPGGKVRKEDQRLYNTILPRIIELIKTYGGVFSSVFVMVRIMFADAGEFIDNHTLSNIARYSLILVITLHYYLKVDSFSDGGEGTFKSVVLGKLDEIINVTYVKITQEFKNLKAEPDILMFLNILKRVINENLLGVYIYKTNQFLQVNLDETNEDIDLRLGDYFERFPEELEQYFLENGDSSNLYGDVGNMFEGQQKDVQEALMFSSAVKSLIELRKRDRDSSIGNNSPLPSGEFEEGRPTKKMRHTKKGKGGMNNNSKRLYNKTRRIIK